MTTYLLIGFLTVATMGLSNTSLGYLNYPTQVGFSVLQNSAPPPPSSIDLGGHVHTYCGARLCVATVILASSNALCAVKC